MDSTLILVFAFVFGALVGSFLNVCIYRMPEGISIVSPPSRCPQCLTRIRPTENIPIISYVVLRAHCRTCGAAISPRYPLVEVLGGLLAVIIVLRFGVTPAALLYFSFAAALLVITFIDLDHQIIPDAISLPGIAIGLTASFVVHGTPPPLHSAAGILVGGGILYAVAVGYEWMTGTEGMGFGDVKLLAMIGAFLGWRAVPLCLLLASLSGSVIGLGVMLLRGKDRKFPIPFGPFLAAGALIALLFGDAIIDWYLGTMAA